MKDITNCAISVPALPLGAGVTGVEPLAGFFSVRYLPET